MFADFDIDGSGGISRGEMEGAIRKLFGDGIGDADIDEMMAVSDTSGDGLVDMSEFKAIMRAGDRLCDEERGDHSLLSRPSLYISPVCSEAPA